MWGDVGLGDVGRCGAECVGLGVWCRGIWGDVGLGKYGAECGMEECGEMWGWGDMEGWGMWGWRM